MAIVTTPENLVFKEKLLLNLEQRWKLKEKVYVISSKIKLCKNPFKIPVFFSDKFLLKHWFLSRSCY